VRRITPPEGYGMLDVWMSHGDHVIEMPEFQADGEHHQGPIAAIADEERGFYGVVPPEVTHTRQGQRIPSRVVQSCLPPVVGGADHRPKLRPDGIEVAEAFTVPLSRFLDPARVLRQRTEFRGFACEVPFWGIHDVRSGGQRP
jgi:hypothetical protein